MITISIIAYLFMGAISEFMIGYSAPTAQHQSDLIRDYFSFFIWPPKFPRTIGNFGAAVRHGKLR